MPKRRQVRRKEETFVRMVDVTSVSQRVSFYSTAPKGEAERVESHAALVIRGTMDAPVRTIHDIEITARAVERIEGGPLRPPCVGDINQVRPYVDACVWIPHVDFDRMWALALAGCLKHARLVFPKPHYNEAAIASISFSSEPEE